MLPTAHRLGIVLTALALSAGAAGAAAPAAAPKGKPKAKATTPPIALLVIVDTSGSMNVLRAGRTRLSYAKEGVDATLGMLTPADYFGVLAFDKRGYVIVPLEHLGSGVAPAIAKMRAGGPGIYVYSALERARAELAAIEVSHKHLLLVVDAANAEEMCMGHDYPPDGGCPPSTPTAHDAARALAGARIGLTVIALGLRDDHDVKPLAELAGSASGKFRLVAPGLGTAGAIVDEVTAAAKRPPRY